MTVRAAALRIPSGERALKFVATVVTALVLSTANLSAQYSREYAQPGGLSHPFYDDIRTDPNPKGQVVEQVPVAVIDPRTGKRLVVPMGCATACGTMVLNDRYGGNFRDPNGDYLKAVTRHDADPTGGKHMRFVARDLRLNGVQSNLYSKTDFQVNPDLITVVTNDGESVVVTALVPDGKGGTIPHALLIDGKTTVDGREYYKVRDPWPDAPNGGAYLKPVDSLDPTISNVLEPTKERVPANPLFNPERQRLDGAIPPAGLESNDAEFKKAYASAVEEGEQTAEQARRTAVEKNSNALTEEMKAVDEEVKAKLGVSEASEVKRVPRENLNEVAETRFEKAERRLDEVFFAKELFDEGFDVGDLLDQLRLATDPSVPDDVANEHFEVAQNIARGMITKGTLGAAFGVVMEAMPVVGAVVAVIGAGYETYTKTVEAAEYLGERSADVPVQLDPQRWFDSVVQAVERGDIKLREGHTIGDLGTAWAEGGYNPKPESGKEGLGFLDFLGIERIPTTQPTNQAAAMAAVRGLIQANPRWVGPVRRSQPTGGAQPAPGGPPLGQPGQTASLPGPAPATTGAAQTNPACAPGAGQVDKQGNVVACFAPSVPGLGPSPAANPAAAEPAGFAPWPGSSPSPTPAVAAQSAPQPTPKPTPQATPSPAKTPKGVRGPGLDLSKPPEESLTPAEPTPTAPPETPTPTPTPRRTGGQESQPQPAQPAQATPAGPAAAGRPAAAASATPPRKPPEKNSDFAHASRRADRRREDARNDLDAGRPAHRRGRGADPRRIAREWRTARAGDSGRDPRLWPPGRRRSRGKAARRFMSRRLRRAHRLPVSRPSPIRTSPLRLRPRRRASQPRRSSRRRSGPRICRPRRNPGRPSPRKRSGRPRRLRPRLCQSRRASPRRRSSR